MSKRQNVDWTVNLYQNAQCTGEDDPKSGAGGLGCTTGILNGSAAGFIRGYIDADCTIILYASPDCDADGDIVEITPETATTCMALDPQIQSYSVECEDV